MPIWEIGNLSSGFATLVCQLHGDEYSSQLIVNEILQLAKSITKAKLGLKIIACANPLGSMLKIKSEPISNLNLNRCFTKEILDRRAIVPVKELITKMSFLIKGSEFVIDIHDMPGSELVLSSILTVNGKLEIEDKNLELIRRFNLAVTWIEDFSSRKIQKRYNGTINSYLNNISVPNFSIETSSVENITEKEIKVVAKKIINLLEKDRKQIRKVPNFVKRIELRSTRDGVFVPRKILLLRQIKKGQKLGVLTYKGRKIDFVSPSSGILIRKVNRKFVKKDEKLFDLAIKI